MRVTPLHKRATDRCVAKATYAAAPLYKKSLEDTRPLLYGQLICLR